MSKRIYDASGDLTIPANVNITGRLNLLPQGSVIMWTQPTIPDGWVRCDGTRGTPDLRGRFILGQGNGSGLTNRTLNQRSGAETHTLTIEQIPFHKHQQTFYNDNYDGHGIDHTGTKGQKKSLEDDDYEGSVGSSSGDGV